MEVVWVDFNLGMLYCLKAHVGVSPSGQSILGYACIMTLIYILLSMRHLSYYVICFIILVTSLE